MNRTLIMTGMIVGSFAGSYIPTIWGDNMFSLTSVILSGIGAFLGIYLAFKISNRIGG